MRKGLHDLHAALAEFSRRDQRLGGVSDKPPRIPWSLRNDRSGFAAAYGEIHSARPYRGDQPLLRPIKYSLFPPLGLAYACRRLITLRMTRRSSWTSMWSRSQLTIHRYLVVIQVYITNAYRAYKIADHYRSKGTFVCLGGLHVTSLPEEATDHADTIFLGPGEQTFPQILEPLLRGEAAGCLHLYSRPHTGTYSAIAPRSHPA